MFLGRVTNWTSVVGQDIPFQTVRNTNTKILNNNGTLNITRAGIWNIDANITLTGVDDDVIVSVYADGVETGSYAEASVTAAGFQNVSIIDAVRTVLVNAPDTATIGLRVDTAGVTVSGTIRVEYVS